MSTRIRWGIIGTGRIAGEFAEGLQQIETAEFRSVASRRQETADAFAHKFGAAHAYPDYQQLAEDPEVDVVYVATPHSLHCENTLLCLKAGKAVICEKPFAVNGGQVAKMIHVAQKQDCFLMEAMWMRFIPLIREARRLISS